MSDELKQKMREIAAEELDKDEVTDIVDAIRRNDSKSSWVAAAVLRAIDRIAALHELQPPKGRAERVKEVTKVICEYFFQHSPAGGTIETSPNVGDGIIPTGMAHYLISVDYRCEQLAEQIVATEPGAMSRDEMVEAVAKLFEKQGHLENAAAVRQQDGRNLFYADGALNAIDALAGQTTANNEAEGPDWLGRICELLGKIPPNSVGWRAYMLIHKDRSGSVEYGSSKGWLCEFDVDEDPEQAIAEYIAGLDKPDDEVTESTVCGELERLGDDFPAI